MKDLIDVEAEAPDPFAVDQSSCAGELGRENNSPLSSEGSFDPQRDEREMPSKGNMRQTTLLRVTQHCCTKSRDLHLPRKACNGYWTIDHLGILVYRLFDHSRSHNPR